MTSIIITGYNQWLASMRLFAEKIDIATYTATKQAAHNIEANIKASFGPAHAAGTPKTSEKPQSITGYLRRSIEVLSIYPTAPDIWQARIAPQTIYARRIELGFTGQDALGRIYPGDPPTGYRVHGSDTEGNGAYAYPFVQPGLEKSKMGTRSIYLSHWTTALMS